MNLIINLVIILSAVVSGLHHSERKSFKGKWSPAIAQLKKSMNDKLALLRRSEPTPAATTLTIVPSSSTKAPKGDGVDIGEEEKGIMNRIGNFIISSVV